jgi:ABC-2 type transport system ATP-binding protein
MLSLEKVYKKPVRTMSLGEQMKCNFVASILHSPKLIFLDEPTIGVDLPSKNALKEAVLDTRERYNSTFLLTTHIVEDIEIADRVLIMDKGKKVFDGSRKKLNGMFGNYRRVELAFGNGKIPELKSYGRIISSKGGVVRMEVSVRALKEKRFINLLASRNVLDYRVSEAGLSHVLSKLYGKLEGKRQVGEDE